VEEVVIVAMLGRRLGAIKCILSPIIRFCTRGGSKTVVFRPKAGVFADLVIFDPYIGGTTRWSRDPKEGTGIEN
jgi:hypothetical protein